MPRSTPLARKKGLAPRSSATRQAYRERRAFVRDLLERHPWCAAGELLPEVCTGWAEHVHEPLTRARGGSIIDPANAVPICGACHRWVHDHPAQATALGLLRSSPPTT